MKSWRVRYRVLAVLALFFGLWGIGRVALAVHQPMGGFLWYYDEAVSGGWIVNLDTGPDWPGIVAGLRAGDRILSIDGRPADEFGEVYGDKLPGESVTYRVRRDGQDKTISNVPIVQFSWGMFVQSQLVIFVVALTFWLLSIFIHNATPESEQSCAFSFFTLFVSLPFFFHAFSISVNVPHYPQALSFLTWKPTFALIAATSVHFATLFPANAPPLPSPFSRSGIRRVFYVMAVVLITGYVVASPPLGLGHWEALAYALNLGSSIASLLLCAVLFGYTAVRTNSFIVRHQAWTMLAGWLIAAFPLVPLLFKLLFPQMPIPPWNLLFILELALPFGMVYAILRYRLFSVRLFLLRMLRYLVPVFGFAFVYLVLFGISNIVPWFDCVQTAFTALTHQRLDLRATGCTLLAALVAFWLYNSFRLWSSKQPYGLESRLSFLLLHLCDRLSVHNGYIALRQGDTFQFQAVHNMALPDQVLDRQAVLGQEEEIALKVPLEAETGAGKTLLGVVALGVKREGQAYSPAEQTFLEETVAELLTTSLRHVQQLEQFANAVKVSIKMAIQVQQEERELQRKLAQAFTVQPEEITADEVEQALRALRDSPPGDLSDLGKLGLADLRAAHARLQAEGLEQSTYHQKGQALRAILLKAIEEMKPGYAQNLKDDQWLYYLILKRAFVQRENWKLLHSDLLLSQPGYFRKRKSAINALVVWLRERERIHTKEMKGK